MDTRCPQARSAALHWPRVENGHIPEGACGVPHGSGAYSLNLTAISRGPLDWLNVWETGEPMPLTSVLNARSGAITANAAIVRAGNGGSIGVMAAADTLQRAVKRDRDAET